MHHSLGHREPLTWQQLGRSYFVCDWIFKIHQEPSFGHVKKLIVMVMLMPMKFSFNDP